jgi:hypothetical protein
MTAPPRTAGTTGRTRTQTPTRESGKPAVQPDRSTGGRGRSTAAERAYARRAHRGQRPGDRPDQAADRRQTSGHRASFVILVMVLLIGGVVATLWFSTQATADAYKLEQAKNATNELSVRVGQLQQQVAQQGSPQSLAQRARQLGMVPAGDIAHLVVGPDGKVTVIGTPTKVTPPPPPPPSTPPSGTTGTSTATSTTTPTTTATTTAATTTATTTAATPPTGG